MNFKITEILTTSKTTFTAMTECNTSIFCTNSSVVIVDAIHNDGDDITNEFGQVEKLEIAKEIAECLKWI